MRVAIQRRRLLGVMREPVADFSEPGEFVCDPYAGSGTTGIACA
jgi:DNA modification methylase